MATLSLRVVSPESIVYEGEASSVVVPAWDGLVGILPGHAPLMALLGVGALDVDLPQGGSLRFHIACGVLKVVENAITVLTEWGGVEPPEELPEGAGFHPDCFTDIASVGNLLA